MKETNWTYLMGLVNGSKEIAGELLGKIKKIKNSWPGVMRAALLIMLLAVPVSAATGSPVSNSDPLIASLIDLINYNKVKVITIVIIVIVVQQIFGYLISGAGKEKSIDTMLSVIGALLVGAFLAYNWETVINFIIGFIPGLPKI